MSQLESLGREALLQTTRKLLAEANALSSRISVLNEIGLAINETLDLERIERIIAKQAKWLLDFDHCSVCLKNGDQWRINTLFGPEEPPEIDQEAMPNLAAVMNTPRPLIIQAGSPSTFLSAYQSQMIIPLSAESGFLGTINFAAGEPNRYTRDDMRIGYMLGLQLSSAIRNASVIAELRSTQAELKMRVEELDAYGHTIAHDLKSPLNNILLNCEMFRLKFGDGVPAEASKMVNTITENANIMTRMTDQLLMLAKLRRADEQLVRVEVRPAIDAALQRFSHQIEQHAIRVEVAEVPDACGQGQWVEEIFANLISNAIKYMGEANPNPTITITGKAQGDTVRYEMRDTGMGIKPEKQGSLFEMFTRAHEKPGIAGLGLGLSIVRRIVEKMGGEIGVQSTYGEGATFWFTLSAAAACEGQ